VLGGMKIPAGKATGRRVMDDMRADLAEETTRHALRTLVPGFYEESVASRCEKTTKDGILKCTKQLRALAKQRALHWKHWRTGLYPDNASESLNKCADSYENLLASKKPSALVKLHCFLPDVYAAPKTRILLRDEGKRAWHEVFSGSAKPRMADGPYYEISIPVYKLAVFSKLRIEVCNYGGQGFRFAELLTKKGRFIPDKVDGTSGIVRDSAHIIPDDYRWTYLGEPNVYKTYHDMKLAQKVHSITVSLKKDAR